MWHQRHRTLQAFSRHNHDNQRIVTAEKLTEHHSYQGYSLENPTKFLYY